MVPSIPARRAYLVFQVLVVCSARASVRVSWSSFGRRLRMRVPRAEVVDYAPQEPGSPDYTPEQAECLAGYRARILELTTPIITHPYWATLSGPDRVEARTALKYAHDTPAGPDA